MNRELAQSMIMSMKMAYSVEIMEYFPPERAKYFLDLVDSIPDDMFGKSRNPKTSIDNAAKLNSFLNNLDKELIEAGMNIEPIKKKIEENNKQMQKAIGIPAHINIEKLLRKAR